MTAIEGPEIARNRQEYRIEINREGYTWAHPSITGADIKRLAHSPADYVVNQITPGPAEDPEIADGQKADLTPKGIERFTTRPPQTGFGNELPA